MIVRYAMSIHFDFFDQRYSFRAISRILTPFSSASVIYNLYLNLGVRGLRSLENYIVEDNVSRPVSPIIIQKF